MRTLGLVLIVAGIAGFVYFGDQLAKAPPSPENEVALTVSETLQYPSGRYEAGRYASATVGFFGVILMMLGKER
jgi:hypothetical protein